MTSLSDSGSQSEDEHNHENSSFPSLGYNSPDGSGARSSTKRASFDQNRSPNFYQETGPRISSPSDSDQSTHMSPGYHGNSSFADEGGPSRKKVKYAQPTHDLSPSYYQTTPAGLGHFEKGSNLSDSEENSEEEDSKSVDLVSDATTASHGMAGGISVASDFISHPKAKKAEYSDFASKMMAKMGYKAGKGLGRSEQGRVEIVEASQQRGRRGLGLRLSGFEPSDVEWNFDKEVVSSDETVDWLPKCADRLPSLETLKNWIKEGPKKMEIEDETEFCDKGILMNVLKSKNVFDELEGEEMRRARTKSNPYETIRGVFFQNRAAMKMANMDAVCDFMFTSPKDEHGNPLVAPHELLYFADVCAGPGGFSEYMLWRKNLEAKGFGFTLKGPCDFKLEEFFAAPSEFFEPHYGVGGLEGDGDIYNPKNLKEFRHFVLENTENKGVHIVSADGGFSVEGQENLQEILSKRLYLCQFLCALSILREGGHFVCKLFDIFTPFSVGLVYLMYRAFREVAIFKPVTSRPANSERYIICKGKNREAQVIHDYMFDVNLRLNKYGTTSDLDIREVVPMEVLQSDDKFMDYIVTSNEELGYRQAISLAKIRAFAQNSDLHEHRQAEIREQCLFNWKIPDQVRTAPNRSEPAIRRFSSLVKEDDMDCFSEQPEHLYSNNLETLIKSVYDYRCFLTVAEKRWFLLGLGKSYVHKWDGQPRSKWMKVDDTRMELPTNTLIEAEFVQELRGEGKGQRRVTAVHVVDAVMLCGVDISDLSYTERIEKIKKFAKALTRPSRSDLAPIRVKDIFRLEEISQVFDKLDMRVVKGSGGQPRLCYRMEAARYYLPQAVVLVKFMKDPWSMAWSQRAKRKYFFNQATGESVFEIRKEAIAPFRSCLKNRRIWVWEDGVKVHNSQRREDPNKLSAQAILNFIHSKTGRH